MLKIVTRYLILRLNNNATLRDIQINYRKLMASEKDPSKKTEIQESFDILIDSTSKNAYDKLLNILDTLNENNLYKRLSLTNEANKDEIKKSYVTLIKVINEIAKILNNEKEISLIQHLTSRLTITFNLINDKKTKAIYDRIIDNGTFYNKLGLDITENHTEIENSYKKIKDLFAKSDDKYLLDNLEGIYCVLINPETRLLYNQSIEDNYYRRLDIDSNATKEELSNKNKKFSSKMHNDKLGLPSDTLYCNSPMHHVREAYETLADDNLRASYDSQNIFRSQSENNIIVNKANNNKYLDNNSLQQAIEILDESINPTPEYLKRERATLNDIQNKQYILYWKKNKDINKALIAFLTTLQTQTKSLLNFSQINLATRDLMLSPLDKNNIQKIILDYKAFIEETKKNIIETQNLIKTHFKDINPNEYISNTNLNEPELENCVYHIAKLDEFIERLVFKITKSKHYQNSDLTSKILSVKETKNLGTFKIITTIINQVKEYEQLFCSQHDVMNLTKYLESKYPALKDQYTIADDPKLTEFENTYKKIENLELFFKYLVKKYITTRPYSGSWSFQVKILTIEKDEDADNRKQNTDLDTKLKNIIYAAEDFERTYINNEINTINNIYYEATGNDLHQIKPLEIEKLEKFMIDVEKKIKNAFIKKAQERKKFLSQLEYCKLNNYTIKQLRKLNITLDAKDLLNNFSNIGFKDFYNFNINIINKTTNEDKLEIFRDNLIKNEENIQLMLGDTTYNCNFNYSIEEQLKQYKDFLHAKIINNFKYFKQNLKEEQKNSDTNIFVSEIEELLKNKHDASIKNLYANNKKLENLNTTKKPTILYENQNISDNKETKDSENTCYSYLLNFITAHPKITAVAALLIVAGITGALIGFGAIPQIYTNYITVLKDLFGYHANAISIVIASLSLSTSALSTSALTFYALKNIKTLEKNSHCSLNP